jgi:hypothetical protein
LFGNLNSLPKSSGRKNKLFCHGKNNYSMTEKRAIWTCVPSYTKILPHFHGVLDED